MTLSNRRKDVKDWKYVNEMGFGSFRNSEVKMDTMGHNRVNGFSQRIFTMIYILLKIKYLYTCKYMCPITNIYIYT